MSRSHTNNKQPTSILKHSSPASTSATATTSHPSSAASSSQMPDSLPPFPDASTAAGLPQPPSELPDSARLEWLWSEYEKQMAEVKQYQEEGMDIYPTPGFVLKTALMQAPSRQVPQFPPLNSFDNSQRTKFFINLCSDPAIAMPSMMPDGQGGEQLRVPISAGPVMLDVEKDGVTKCLVCDVVFNPDSIAKANKEKEFRHFLSSFALQKLEDKYKIQLDNEMNMKFPKLKYKGPPGASPAPQHIRRPKTAHVELDEDDSKSGSDDAMEERRKAAAEARMKALKEMEAREGIQVSNAAQAKQTQSTQEIFLSHEAAAQSAASTPLSHSHNPKLNPANAVPAHKKIEVMSEERTTPKPASSTTIASSSTSTSTSTPAASASVADPRLPPNRILYRKSSTSDQFIPASEWDHDLDLLPHAIRVEITLSSVKKTSEEIELDVSGVGLDLKSAPAFLDKHDFELHMQFPFQINEAEAAVSFSKKTHTLTCVLPVVGKRDVEKEDQSLAAAAAEVAAKQALEMQQQQKPAVDFQEQLALTNSIMWNPVSDY